jgi:hypothetical protein
MDEAVAGWSAGGSREDLHFTGIIRSLPPHVRIGPRRLAYGALFASGYCTASIMALTFSYLAVGGTSHPEASMKPVGPISRMSRWQ